MQHLAGKSLKRNFWNFIWPSIIAQWIFALYTMVDGLFVAWGVSEVALSAVNIASPLVNFLFSVSILFAVGASTVVAIFMGQDHHAAANKVYTQNLVVLMVISILITVLVLWRVDDVAIFLGATEETIGYVKEYILNVMPFAWCFMIAYSFEILVKTDGYPLFATLAVTSGALMNLVLDYVFVMLLHKGVGGAAFATGLSQLALVGIYLTHFLSKKANIKLARFHFDWRMMLRTIKIGLPSGLTEFSAGITVFLFNHFILRYIGAEGIISYTIIAYVNTIVVMSLVGIAQGSQPLISFYYGRGEAAICQKLLRYGFVAALVLAGIVFGASWLLADWITGLFISSQMEMLRVTAARVFRIFSISFLLMGFNIVVGGYFTAIERPKSALAISLGRGVITVIIALEVMTFLFGGAGIWWAPLISEFLCLMVTCALFFVYRKQRKEKKPVVETESLNEHYLKSEQKSET